LQNYIIFFYLALVFGNIVTILFTT